MMADPWPSPIRIFGDILHLQVVTVSSEGEREGVRGRGREQMGKERDAKRSRSSDEEELRCGALFIGGS